MATHEEIVDALTAALADLAAGASDEAPTGIRLTFAETAPSFEAESGVKLSAVNAIERNTPLATRFREGAHRGEATAHVAVFECGAHYYFVGRVPT
jgi:hypothetical protein